jgi:Fe-S-cluster containining protein
MMEGVHSSMVYLIYCKNLCKSNNVSLPSTTIKRKKKKTIKDQFLFSKKKKKKIIFEFYFNLLHFNLVRCSLSVGGGIDAGD